ncbi:MAG: hypothetical protein NWE75_05360 [Candidatus Bathyarchaeota archaeon]|nr:hypothetical protein [Candidatus Bathyarchaeota archaeon]
MSRKTDWESLHNIDLMKLVAQLRRDHDLAKAESMGILEGLKPTMKDDMFYKFGDALINQFNIIQEMQSAFLSLLAAHLNGLLDLETRIKQLEHLEPYR